MAASPEPGHHRCPGCGATLPGQYLPGGRRTNASAACLECYGRVMTHEAEHLTALGRFHQLTVDAYGAQHPGPAATRIGTAFGLIGLRLALDDGWTGLQVRDAHQYLAGRHRDWPIFAAPAQPWPFTVVDVVASLGSTDAHATAVQRWAEAVWSGWAGAHDDVARLIDERLPPDVVGRIRAG